MSNFYDFLANTKEFKKFKVDDLLFAEYKCFDEGITTELWTHNNFFSFILKGEMLWTIGNQELLVKKGESFFVKKGSIKVKTFYKEDFCELIVFVPDDFIKGVIDKYKISCKTRGRTNKKDSIFPLQSEKILTAYFDSLLSYFAQKKPPPKSLLRLKFEELIINIISNENNIPLINHFKRLCEKSKIPISEIMEANFTSNLKLNDFARLCGRSLSTFKRDFFKSFGTTPGNWLINKRLEFAKNLLDTTDKNIYEIIFDSGFKDRSHFIRKFKNEFGITPLKYRRKLKLID
jgi:AraC-like DNA-binding protein